MKELLSELVERYETIALRYVESWVRSKDTAADLYQGVIERILESETRFASLAHLRNYFFVALRNAAFDELRRSGRSSEVLPGRECRLEERVDPKARLPQEELIAQEELVRLRSRWSALSRAIEDLPGRERTLLYQRFFERKKFREIQDMTGTPISTLKSREQSVLRKLRKKLENPVRGP